MYGSIFLHDIEFLLKQYKSVENIIKIFSLLLNFWIQNKFEIYAFLFLSGEKKKCDLFFI